MSQVLCDFPLLAGRFSGSSIKQESTGAGASILHNNAGVPVVIGKDSHASSDLSVTPILEDGVPSISAKNLPSYLNSMNLSRCVECWMRRCSFSFSFSFFFPLLEYSVLTALDRLCFCFALPGKSFSREGGYHHVQADTLA